MERAAPAAVLVRVVPATVRAGATTEKRKLSGQTNGGRCKGGNRDPRAFIISVGRSLLVPWLAGESAVLTVHIANRYHRRDLVVFAQTASVAGVLLGSMVTSVLLIYSASGRAQFPSPRLLIGARGLTPAATTITLAGIWLRADAATAEQAAHLRVVA